MSQQKAQPRAWRISAEDYESWDDFESALQREALRLADISYRIGGSCYIEPQREQDDTGLWHTTAAVFAWNSFVPGKRKPAKAPEPEDNVIELPQDDEEPVAA